MKKSLLLILCFATFLLAAPLKVSKACSKANGEKACSESLVELAERGKSGDTLAIELYEKTLAAIRKNKKFMKPVMVKVDTLLWEPCKKKDASACLEACTARTDSSFLREDAPDSSACAASPQKIVSKKVNVPTPSRMQVLVDSLNRDVFWNSPFELAKRWNSAFDDSTFLPLDSVTAEILSADPADFVFAKKRFYYCSVFGDSLNARLDSLNAPVRCPVIGSVTDPRDGRLYRVERFGEKIWMIDNLAFDIPDSSACYDGDSLNCEKYGRLYPFEQAKRACPEGFRTATDEDFESLSAADVADFAVTVVFGGYFNQNGICALAGEGTYFWTSSEEDASRGFVRNLFADANSLEKASVDKKFGLSVRCVQE